MTLSSDSWWLVVPGTRGRLGARSEGLYWPIAPKVYGGGAYAETIPGVTPLETARLVLREYSYDDWPTVLAYQSDPRYLRYYPWSERDATTVRDWIAGLVARQRDEPREVFQLAITLPDQGGQLIGSCGVHVNDNAASAHVLQKVSMRREAHFREQDYFKGRWWDGMLYAILDREWRAL